MLNTRTGWYDPLNTDRYEYAGLVLTVVTCVICAVFTTAWAARLINRAMQPREAPPPAGGLPRRLMTRLLPWAGPVVVCCVLGLVVTSSAYEARKLANTPVPRGSDVPPWGESSQSAEWLAWRAQIHEQLAFEPITDEKLLDAVRVKLPSLPAGHNEADLLRRDQAVADVLLSYKGVRDILAKRFGIREGFLGTGLSKPLGETPYAHASVHEYLVRNYPDSHEHVWLWKMTSLGRTFSTPIQTLVAGEKDSIPPDNRQKKDAVFEDDLKEILLRVKNKDHPIPPMIRFARLDQSRYKNTLGRPEASRVFTSNLAEVWDLTIQQAAEKSGYRYKGDGDTLFVWIFVPYHSNEFTPATWRNILESLPEWLDETP